MDKLKVLQKEYQTSNPFIDQYNWKELNFPSNRKDWNEFEKNNKLIAFNMLYEIK